MVRLVYGLIVDKKKKQLQLIRPKGHLHWSLPVVGVLDTDTGEEDVRDECRRHGCVVRVRRAIVAIQGEKSCPVAFTCKLLHTFRSDTQRLWVNRQELPNYTMDPDMLRMAWDALSVLQDSPGVSFEESDCVHSAYLLVPHHPHIYRQDARNLTLLWERLHFPQVKVPRKK